MKEQIFLNGNKSKVANYSNSEDNLSEVLPCLCQSGTNHQPPSDTAPHPQQRPELHHCKKA